MISTPVASQLFARSNALEAAAGQATEHLNTSLKMISSVSTLTAVPTLLGRVTILHPVRLAAARWIYLHQLGARLGQGASGRVDVGDRQSEQGACSERPGVDGIALGNEINGLTFKSDTLLALH
jgi:hypothetical protein